MGDLLELIASGRRFSVARFLAVTAPFFFSSVLISNVAFAADSESSRTEHVRKDSNSASSKTQTPDEGDPQKKLKIVQSALLMLLGIVFVGMVLLSLVILWGVRVRRNAKKSLPTQKALDELWYLKPEKKKASAEMVRDADDESGSDDPDVNDSDQS